jgi:hypothetical protein
MIIPRWIGLKLYLNDTYIIVFDKSLTILFATYKKYCAVIVLQILVRYILPRTEENHLLLKVRLHFRIV